MQVWELHEQGKLIDVVDKSLNEDFDAEEACRFLKVGLLCTQDMPKSRPNMTTVVSMLMGEVDVDDKISRPGLITELMGIKGGGAKKSGSGTTSGSGKQENSSLLSVTATSAATMTFNSIYDRSG